MDRRQFVASLGVLAGGGATAMGTGAFSAVQAQRDVTISVADDASAYLAIRPTEDPNGNYVDQEGNDTLAIDLTEENNNVGNGIAGGQGLNVNAFTTMADVFEVKNQGTQTVELDVEPLLFFDDLLDFDHLLAVFLVPQDPDDIDIDYTFPADLDVMAIKNLGPGKKLQFGILGLALPEDAIDSTSISDDITFEATEVDQ